MKNFYDKLLLLLGLLALIGGGFVYMSATGELADQGELPVFPPANNPYLPKPVPDSDARDAAWPEPVHQSSGPNWLYDVFTPPKIYLDPDGNFTAEPPQPPQPPQPFGIYLAEMERKPFRLQMQGFSGDRNRPEEAVLFFFDEERQVRFFIRQGMTNADSEVELLNFSVDRQIDEQSNVVEVTAVATIRDLRSGEELKLNDASRLFEPEITVVFRSEQDSRIDVTLEVDPDEPVTSFETSQGKYILREINLEERSVTLEKQASEDHEAEIRVLSPENFIQPEAPDPEETPLESPDNEDDFDLLFR